MIMKAMESLFYLRWDKGREAMAAPIHKPQIHSKSFFENEWFDEFEFVMGLAAPREQSNEINEMKWN